MSWESGPHHMGRRCDAEAYEGIGGHEGGEAVSMKHDRRFNYYVSLGVHIDAAYDRIKDFLIYSALSTNDIDMEFEIVESEDHL